MEIEPITVSMRPEGVFWHLWEKGNINVLDMQQEPLLPSGLKGTENMNNPLSDLVDKQ
jgi:hypothetical protein